VHRAVRQLPPDHNLTRVNLVQIARRGGCTIGPPFSMDSDNPRQPRFTMLSMRMTHHAHHGDRLWSPRAAVNTSPHTLAQHESRAH
jgi:hypothetical protein